MAPSPGAGAHHVHGAYRLPDGLPDAALAVVVARDDSFVVVEHDGRGFEVPLASVASGFRVIRAGHDN